MRKKIAADVIISKLAQGMSIESLAKEQGLKKEDILSALKHVAELLVENKSSNYYKPGIYRFKSFEDAREHDLKMMIEHAVKKEKRC